MTGRVRVSECGQPSCLFLMASSSLPAKPSRIASRPRHVVVGVPDVGEAHGQKTLAPSATDSRESKRDWRHISRRPSMAFTIVTSSAYSNSEPTGIPIAMRLTFTPSGLMRREI